MQGKPRDMSKHTLTHFAKLLESAFSRIDALEKRVDSLNHHQEVSQTILKDSVTVTLPIQDADECVGGECVTRLSSQVHRLHKHISFIIVDGYPGSKA